MDMKIRLLIEHRRKTFKRYVLWYRKLQIPFYQADQTRICEQPV